MKIFSLLHKGDDKIIDIFKKAHALWENKLQENRDVKSLAKELGDFQLIFEHEMKKFGLERYDGQEIFVVSGLTYFSRETNDESEKAENIRKAFEFSFCSIEVKGLAKRFAKALYLGDY
ncbi:hypothetical protein [Morganella morganii]|uniref:hypothetical protein n=1 Tax=Morganella morganii TaxID=582 RepID=UPI002DE48E1F|nr:hypothetical protein [Morganella morganii]